MKKYKITWIVKILLAFAIILLVYDINIYHNQPGKTTHVKTSIPTPERIVLPVATKILLEEGIEATPFGINELETPESAPKQFYNSVTPIVKSLQSASTPIIKKLKE